MKTSKTMKLLFLIACICAIFAICYGAYYSQMERVPLTSEYHLLLDSDPWQVLSGSRESSASSGDVVDLIGTELVICKTVYPEALGENVLFFRNNRQCVTVTAAGELLFRLGAGERHFEFGTTGYCAVPLPEVGAPYVLEITFSNLSDGNCDIPVFYYSSLNDILIFLCLKDLPTLVLIPFWLMLAILMVALALIMLHQHHTELRMISLGLFLLAAAGWNVTELYILPIFPINMELNGTVGHYLLMLLPIPVLFFIYLSSTNRPLRYCKAFFVILLLNVIVQTLLFVTGRANLHEMVLVSQAMLMVLMVYGTAAMALDYRAKPTRTGFVQILAFSVSALMGGLVILAYWFQPDGVSLYRTLFQSTILVFLFSMMVVVFFSLEEYTKQKQLEDAELAAYRTISTTDQLTGLKNRRAFDQQLSQVEMAGSALSNAVLSFMDLNGLKYANDQYGHMAGDELIIGAGKCIQAAFEPLGTTYRIGGDEFASIILGDAEMESCYGKMDALVAAYNESAKVPLSIARGSSKLVTADGRRLTISDWKMMADRRMYEDKVQCRTARTKGSADDYLELISSFVSAVDAKDAYTADHSQRVGRMADCICLLLGLSDASREQIHIAACLHDIGKIGIPDSILCKPDKLTESEWHIMQSHPVVGEEIIKHNHAFYEVSKIIRHHHERIDGKGYPDGLKGFDIPLGSRIIAIADSIDAMTSSRSYREAKSLSYCREEIKNNLDIMYDRAIGEIVLDNWSQIENIILPHS